MKFTPVDNGTILTLGVIAADKYTYKLKDESLVNEELQDYSVENFAG